MKRKSSFSRLDFTFLQGYIYYKILVKGGWEYDHWGKNLKRREKGKKKKGKRKKEVKKTKKG